MSSGVAEHWPRVERGGLAAFVRGLGADVTALERAYLEGRLEAALGDADLERRLGARLFAAYRRLATDRPTPLAALRASAIEGMLAQARAGLLSVVAHADAWAHEVAPCRHGTGEGRVVAVRARLREPRAEAQTLRVDQLVAARFWRIAFHFDDPALDDEMTSAVAHAALARLAAEIGQLRAVLACLAHRERPPTRDEVRIVPRPVERAFEQLVLDVLNEHERCARQAPVSEDFLQKTDLRVSYPGLGRRNGGRLQVTRISHPDRLREKLAEIRNLDELVVLSPLTLAAFVQAQYALRDDAARVLGDAEIDAVGACLAALPSSVEGLAEALKRELVTPLRGAPRHPLGPMSQVPMAVRELLRVFVRAEVFRATAALRARQRAEAPPPAAGSEPGVEPDAEAMATAQAGTSTASHAAVDAASAARPRAASAAAEKPRRRPRHWVEPTPDELLEQRAFVESLTPGRALRGVVRCKRLFGAFVDLGPLDGLLHVHTLVDAPTRDAYEALAVGDLVDVVVLGGEVASRRVALCLPCPACQGLGVGG